MNHSTLIEKLSDKEKLMLMEELWTSLREPQVEYVTPDWHLSELEQREQSISENGSDFIDWNDAKKEINSSIK